MKIAYSHLVSRIQENPTLEMISNSLFQLGHEHEVEGNIFNMEFTPNRGDCLSLNGLLRDLSVFYTINHDQKIYTEKLDNLQIDFENLSQDICPQISFLKLDKVFSTPFCPPAASAYRYILPPEHAFAPSDNALSM